MKRKLWFGTACLALAFAVTSCEELGGCEKCKMVTRTSAGDIVNSGAETEYCGSDLVTIKATPVSLGRRGLRQNESEGTKHFIGTRRGRRYGAELSV